MIMDAGNSLKSTFVTKKQGVLVLMDRLGTKGIWKQDNPDIVINHWLSFIEAIKKKFNKELKKRNYDTHFASFSDSIFITIYGKDKEESVLDVGAALVWVLGYSMCMGIHFRGCISYGLIVESSNSIIGPAIDEAAEYYTLQQWLGISAAPSVHNILSNIDSSRLDSKNIRPTFVKYDIPLKESIEKNGWAVNWTMLNSNATPKYKNKQFSSLEEYVQYNLETATSIPYVLKWRNTLDFLLKFKS